MRNWAGNYGYRATRIHRPRTVEQLQEVVSAAPRVRVLGSRHSFTGIADSDELVSLADLPRDIQIAGARASCSAAMTYGELAVALQRADLALHNIASLPHISVGGAIATATHGSGDRLGNLATSVASLEFVTSTGEITRTSRGDPDFDGTVVGLGALGAVTRVTLDVEPAYDVRQTVFERLSWQSLCDRFEQVMSYGYSVSVFTSWGEAVDQVWVKSRGAPPESLFDAATADRPRHPIAGLDPANCTDQLGAAGPFFERLAHFRMGFTPSSGEELQSELFVPRERAVDAIDRVRSLAAFIRPVLQVSEIRTIAADGLWMSPQYGRDSVAIHFTWTQSPQVARAIAAVEAALAPLGARPHWGKLFSANPAHLYERLPEFIDLAERLDRRGAFRNDWFDEVLVYGKYN